ncbi:Hypothetical protein PMT_2538 [Prochlorococcus marinus str. MIT 9313]|uniref:Uncharacterized protein n=1 Tax=Prochlorococcus marinus (strain MIT 9313) TaxID=74547 RepID=B9ERV8_PROMM|nr:hypothetical protein [Prochlorococcus marinus]CAX32057.1 Hypothetical protein PMT_2538 [Prochlorococcus marinus str. MIT 9313]
MSGLSGTGKTQLVCSMASAARRGGVFLGLAYEKALGLCFAAEGAVNGFEHWSLCSGGNFSPT